LSQLAVENLREAIETMMKVFGFDPVFKNIDKNIDCRFVEVEIERIHHR
jgi:hypothetical protein